MEDLIFLLSASLLLYKSRKKYHRLPIGTCGCSVDFLNVPVSFDHTKTNDGDEMFYLEHQEGAITYGVVCAILHEHLGLEEGREVMKNYMNRLHDPFQAMHHVGIADCPEITDNYIKVVDYWQDREGTDWEVKGYTDGRIVAVLYVKNINDAAVDKQDIFLDSFRFDWQHDS